MATIPEDTYRGVKKEYTSQTPLEKEGVFEPDIRIGSEEEAMLEFLRGRSPAEIGKIMDYVERASRELGSDDYKWLTENDEGVRSDYKRLKKHGIDPLDPESREAFHIACIAAFTDVGDTYEPLADLAKTHVVQNQVSPPQRTDGFSAVVDENLEQRLESSVQQVEDLMSAWFNTTERLVRDYGRNTVQIPDESLYEEVVLRMDGEMGPKNPLLSVAYQVFAEERIEERMRERDMIPVEQKGRDISPLYTVEGFGTVNEQRRRWRKVLPPDGSLERVGLRIPHEEAHRSVKAGLFVPVVSEPDSIAVDYNIKEEKINLKRRSLSERLFWEYEDRDKARSILDTFAEQDWIDRETWNENVSSLDLAGVSQSAGLPFLFDNWTDSPSAIRVEKEGPHTYTTQIQHVPSEPDGYTPVWSDEENNPRKQFFLPFSIEDYDPSGWETFWKTLDTMAHVPLATTRQIQDTLRANYMNVPDLNVAKIQKETQEALLGLAELAEDLDDNKRLPRES